MKSALTRAIERTERAKREEIINEHYRNDVNASRGNHRRGSLLDRLDEAMRLARAARKARADIIEWEAAELEARAMMLRADAAKIRSKTNVAE